MVKANCEIILKGNCEAYSYYVHEDIDLSGRTQVEINDLIWHRDKLTPETRKDFNNLDYCYEFYMSGRLVRLLHAHPERLNQLVGNSLDIFRNDEKEIRKGRYRDMNRAYKDFELRGIDKSKI